MPLQRLWRFMAPLARGFDHLDGLHANTRMLEIVGFQRVYEATGDAATTTSLDCAIASAQGKPIRLIPYHRIANERYATYWQVTPGVA